MARVDNEAAKIEIEKGKTCVAHAKELAVIARTLREEADDHFREADQLRGVPRRPVRHRRR